MAAVFDIELHDTDTKEESDDDDIIEISEVINRNVIIYICLLNKTKNKKNFCWIF